MQPTDTAHKACFKKVKSFVREDLKIDRFKITNFKIIQFCWEHENKPNKVIKSLKKYAKRMNQLDLERIQTNSKTLLTSCKIFFSNILIFANISLRRLVEFVV